MKADGKLSSDGIVSSRHYLADAAFLAGLDGNDRTLLEKAHAALRNPVWQLFLGRKSFLPSEPVWLENGLRDEPLETALAAHPCLDPRRATGKAEDLLLSLESREPEGTLLMDQPLSSFAERRFGSRYVVSRSVPRPESFIREWDKPNLRRQTDVSA
jgi:CRISPR system Cascade subunit CasD